MKGLLHRVMLFITLISSIVLAPTLFAAEKILNVYTWSGVIPEFAIQQFEKETGIKVNFSTYDSNEIMYAKLKASKTPAYDIIEPSSYYIDRMRRQDMLEKLDKSKLPLFKNLESSFLNKAYDPHNNYSVPFIWGITGIFVNNYYFPSAANSISKWSDLWDEKYQNQLMLLDDSREVFSMALLALGYPANDNNPEHIKAAYLKLKELMPNIKVFKSDGVITILIDEDANIGMAWNGELIKAKKENPNLSFIFPKDGFVIWVDNFAIPKNAPHQENAYKFLNFMLRADIAKAVSLSNDFPTPNRAAKNLLPPEVRNNPLAYPSAEILQRGEFQTDVSEAALALYEKYWEKLKMGGE